MYVRVLFHVAMLTNWVNESMRVCRKIAIIFLFAENTFCFLLFLSTPFFHCFAIEEKKQWNYGIRCIRENNESEFLIRFP